MKISKKDLHNKHILSTNMVILLLFLPVMLVAILIKTQDTTPVIHDISTVNYSKGWHNDDGKEITIGSISSKTGFSTKNYTRLYRKIDDNIKPGDYLCFRASNTDIKIFIGNKQVINTPYTPNVFLSKGTGSVWSFYRFKESDIGKKITLEIKPYYKGSNLCKIIDMSISEPYTYISEVVKDNAFFIIVSISLFIVGIVFILINITVNKMQHIHSYTLIYLGLFINTFAVWLLCTIEILSLITNQPQLVQTVSSNLIYILPLLGLLFLNGIFNFKPKRLFKIFCYSIVVLYGIAWILHLLNILDLHASIILTYANAILSLLYIVVLTITTGLASTAQKEVLEEKSKNKFFNKPMLYFAIICVVLDSIMIILRTNAPCVFIGCYLIFLMVLLCSKAVTNLFTMSKDLAQATFIAQLAYKDALTNLGNRTAYMEKLDDLRENLATHSNIGYVAFDVNNLKTVNDTYGHSVGDSLIIDTAELLKKSFDENCNIYRIGGDEFAIIIDHSDAKSICKLGIIQFNKHVNDVNNFMNKQYKISVAHGSSFYSTDENQTIDEIVKTADSIMYSNKKEMKALAN